MSEGPFFFFCIDASVRRFAHRRTAVLQLKSVGPAGVSTVARRFSNDSGARDAVVERRQLCVSLWDFLAHAQQIAFAFKQSRGG
jgi:hypothetical protein